MKHSWWSIRPPSKFQVNIIFLGWDMGHWNLRLTEHKFWHMHHIYMYIYIYIYIWCTYIYIYIYIWCICQNLCSVKRKFQCPISQPRKMIFTWNFEGGLIDHQLCFIQNFKFLAVQELVFLKSKFGQNRPLTLF